MVYNIRPRSFFRELLIAVVIMFNAICLLVNEIMPSIHNFGDNLVVLIFLLGTVICLLNRKILLRRFLLINVSILLWMLASFVFYDFDIVFLEKCGDASKTRRARLSDGTFTRRKRARKT